MRKCTIRCEIATVRAELDNLMLTSVYRSAILVARLGASGTGLSWERPGVCSRLARTHLGVMKRIFAIFSP